MAGEVFVLNIIPIVVSIIILVNAVKAIKQAKEYIAKPANTPFGPVQKARSKMIGFLVMYLILGLNFIAPMLFAALSESLYSIEDDMGIFVFIQFLLIVFYISALVAVIAALVKLGEAARKNNQIILSNRASGTPTVNWNTVIPQSSSPLDALNRGRQIQNPAAPNVVIPTMDNSVPEGYEAPPDLKQTQSGFTPNAVQYNTPYQAQAARTPQVQPNQRPQPSIQRSQAPNQWQQPPAQGAQPSNQWQQPSPKYPNTSSIPKAAPVIISMAEMSPTKNQPPKPTLTPTPNPTLTPAETPTLTPTPKPDTDILQSQSIPPMPNLQPTPEIKSINSTVIPTVNPFESKGEKRCHNCGVVNPDKNNFCEFCGKEL